MLTNDRDRERGAFIAGSHDACRIPEGRAVITQWLRAPCQASVFTNQRREIGSNQVMKNRHSVLPRCRLRCQ